MPIASTETRPLPSPAEGGTAAYDCDFFSWAARQAELLRAGRLSEADLEHLAEEIEDLGKSTRLSLASHVRTVIEHLMKLQASPSTQPRQAWRDTIRRVRVDIEQVLEKNPSLRRELPAIVVAETARARRLAVQSMVEHGEEVAGLEGMTFDVERVLGPWLPE